MFSMCPELTPRARIPDTRIPQLMQPCCTGVHILFHKCTHPITQMYTSYYTMYISYYIGVQCTYPLVHSLLHRGTYPIAQVYISYNTNVNTPLHKYTYPINQVYAPPEWVGEHHYNGEALSVWELGTQYIFLKVQNL